MAYNPLDNLAYQCYYMNNDGREQVIATFKGVTAYKQAVNYCGKNQKNYNTGLEYEFVNLKDIAA